MDLVIAIISSSIVLGARELIAFIRRKRAKAHVDAQIAEIHVNITHIRRETKKIYELLSSSSDSSGCHEHKHKKANYDN